MGVGALDGAPLTQKHDERPLRDQAQAGVRSQCARAVEFPAKVVVDLTTWSTTRERSRLPVNHYTGYVDIMVNPDGTVSQ